MEIISLKDPHHKFDKVNLVTQRNKNGYFDEYKCEYCGLKGKRYRIDSEVLQVRKAKVCTHKAEIVEQVNLGKALIIHDHPSVFGFEKGKTYERVPCPVEFLEKYSDDIWIYSEKRKEAVRLLDHEAKRVE